MADAELTVRISADTGSLDSAIRKVNNELTGMEKNIESKGKNLKSIGEGIDTVTKPIQRLAAVTAAGGVAAAKFAIDFEDSFAGVKKTVDGTPEQLDRIRQSIIDMSTKGINGHSAIPQTTKELNELAAAGGQLGIKTENIADFTETMAMLGSATNLSGEEGAKTLARFMNVAGVSQDKIGNLGSAIVDLGNNFATTEAEIADMAMNMGATGAAVGISAQDILAYSTTLSSLGAEAAAGGSAISRIWMDIQQAVSEGGSALESFAATSGKSSAEFADSWKKDASGAFRDFIEGLGKSEDIIGKLQELGFNNIRDLQALQKLAGPQGLELLNNALEMSNSAWKVNTALQNEFNAKSETTASQLAITKNNLIEAGRAVGETLLPAVSGGAVKVKEFAQGIADMSDGQKQALVTTGKWVIGLGATGKAASSVFKGAGKIIETASKFKSAGGVLGKLAPALTSIGTAAPYAAAGIAAVGTAVYVGKKAYDAWYDSQYRWSEGLGSVIKSFSQVFDGMAETSAKYQNTVNAKGEVKPSWLENLKSSMSTNVNKSLADISKETRKTVIHDYGDIWVNPNNTNQALAIIGGVIALANGRTSDGDWDWSAFGDWSGFTADVINAGVLNTSNVVIKSGDGNTQLSNNLLQMKDSDNVLRLTMGLDGGAYAFTLYDRNGDEVFRINNLGNIDMKGRLDTTKAEDEACGYVIEDDKITGYKYSASEWLLHGLRVFSDKDNNTANFMLYIDGVPALNIHSFVENGVRKTAFAVNNTAYDENKESTSESNPRSWRAFEVAEGSKYAKIKMWGDWDIEDMSFYDGSDYAPSGTVIKDGLKWTIRNGLVFGVTKTELSDNINLTY